MQFLTELSLELHLKFIVNLTLLSQIRKQNNKSKKSFFFSILKNFDVMFNIFTGSEAYQYAVLTAN